MTNRNWTIIDGGLKAENDTPVVVGFSDLVLLEGFASYGIPIDSLFTDPEGDTLKLTVTTGGGMAITASFENDTLTLTEMGIGVNTVYLTANDIIDESVQVMDTFLVTVKENDPPRITNPLADLTLNTGFGTRDLNISNVFEDDQPLMVSVNVTPAGVVNAVLSGNTLTLTEVGTGTTSVMVTASDGALQTIDTFLVTVKANVPPRVANALVDLTLNTGFGTRDLDISNVFEDEDPLMFSVNVATAGVVNAVLSGNTLTPHGSRDRRNQRHVNSQ